MDEGGETRRLDAWNESVSKSVSAAAPDVMRWRQEDGNIEFSTWELEWQVQVQRGIFQIRPVISSVIRPVSRDIRIRPVRVLSDS